ncbi:MAG: hypothetical protein A2487_15250 [Candidatus Raymondbacteria bacterium RifOxyC12_full_50_8]|uniref:Secretion system C-terminal sorting domain-containing protein n=1 Tax=Candidatus Raymondbacteria bacterium RIFOXYD12_FULL_49_13 TaxID=1817890 RepID=A0A1F7FJH7_UNCRA|nr:MAG: hypothetical protein A2248_09470 [Candidatus Raymondbacteria bacterium RIFOXYA2_FULL_49_16]OGJ96338.1 MAG: hypothetical protein A2453_08420 [Candidatus Raymondbacteria bacterium RIFOXYC2_FULL_50_21]OGK03727.1 MAG: hypothetical protein A2487_15250 [Candidatus Raymondbacteria bacterium RifOxyC12_full_50_8]OGK06875.1 MAG: hypothetical protein A2519_11490 [Candidatus Raymondbacteria bacterium RIFOXYD12_FULL_49_13]OGP44030.1 MAG: hypothetical protein A2324_14080 [Candidatus Raymondbacteria b
MSIVEKETAVRKLFFLAIAILTLFLSISGYVPTNVTVVYHSGQVFLTWDKPLSALADTEYTIYCNTSPITQSDLIAANKRVVVPSDHASNPILNFLANDVTSGWQSTQPPIAIVRNIITPLDPLFSGCAQQVPDNKNMVVLTTQVNGSYYYAVTATTGGVEDKSITSGNSAGPVIEIKQEPEPVLIWQSEARTARMYLQYMDIEHPMFNKNPPRGIYAWPYWVGVKDTSVSQKDTCVMELYLIGGHQTMNGIGDGISPWDITVNKIDVVVKPTDWDCWWFGYSQTMDFQDQAPQKAVLGPVVNYTQARVMDFLKWMIKESPYYSPRIDTNRIFVLGNSNGGYGTLTFTYNYPSMFAFSMTSSGEENPVRYVVDTVANKGILTAFYGWRSEYLVDHYSMTKAADMINIPHMLSINKGSALPFVFIRYGGQDSYSAYARGYFPAFNDSRQGWCGGVDGSAGHDGGQVPACPQLRTLRKNNSYPAFSNASGNAALPMPNPYNAADDYMFNTYFMWSTPYYQVGGFKNQVDETNRYEIVIASTAGDVVADITPRRMQRFDVVAGKEYILKNTGANDTNTVYQTDTVTADLDGLVTATGFQVKSGDQDIGGSRLIIVPKDPVTHIERSSVVQDGFLAVSIAPNPFNPTAVVLIQDNSLGARSRTSTIKIFDIRGKQVVSAIAAFTGNTCTYAWNAGALHAGMYLMEINAGKYTVIKKAILIK